MSDQEQEQTPEQTAPSLEEAGRALIAAREKMGLSVAEAASRMRLTTKQVEAMESGNLADLPGATFTRGFLRNYARLLQIDAAPLLEAYRVHGAQTAPGDIRIHSENIRIKGKARARKIPTHYLAAIVVMLALLAAWVVYEEFAGRKNAPPIAEPVQKTEPPNATTDKPAEQTQPLELPQTMPAATATPISAPSSVAVSTSAVALQTPAPPAPVNKVPGAGTVAMTAAQSTWVGVTDKDGKVILNRHLAEGESATVSGAPPLKVDIGNATGMTVTYNGKPVDVASRIRSNVAHLTLE
ncbi:MAG: DUF4115 domain-containing protein [Methylobacillus sp.]|jgi:cytoskeleton protein RodZ|nr:DUF4115 domain-containing protein [Methylobacillus sp.]